MLLSFALSTLATSVLEAQTALSDLRTWVRLTSDTGGNDNFGRNQNWTGGNEPNSNLTRGLFNTSGLENPEINQNRTVGQLWFTSGSSAITFAEHANDNTLTFDASNGDGLVHEGNVTHIFDANIALGSNQTWYLNGTSGDLEVNDDFDLNSFILTLDTVNTGNSVLLSSTKGAIIGTGGITKIGLGTLNITGANTYSGATTLNGGKTVISNDTALGATSGDTTIGASGTLELQNDITIGSGESLANSGDLLNAQDDNTFAGAITGSGTITVTGGNLTLSGANSYSGTTNVSAGTLTYGASNVIGTGAVNVSGGTLDLGASQSDTVGTITVSGGGSITGTGTSALTTTGTLEMQNGSVAAILAGSSALNKTTGGTVTLSSDNTYTGTTSVSAGTLVVSGQTDSATMDIASGSVLEFNVASGTRDNGADTKFTGTGTLEKTGSGTLVWGSSEVEFDLGSGGLIDVSEGTLVGGSYGNDIWTSNLSDLNVDSGATFNGVEANVRVDALTGSGTIQSGYGGAGYTEFTFGVDNGSGDFSGVLANSTATGNFVKIGTGTQTLSGDNTYTGLTSVNAGTLVVSGQTDSATMDIASGAVLEFNVASGTRSNAADTKFTGTGTLEKTGSGTMQWTTNAAEFALGSGALIDIQGGVFRGGHSGNEIWTSNLSDLNVASGAIFRSVEANVRVDVLTGSGTIETGYNGAGYTEFTIGVDNGTGDFAGVISDYTSPGNLVKTGSGTQTLSGANTFTGTMTVDEGTLVAANNAALGANTANAIVNTGSTISLDGGVTVTKSTGTLTLNSAGASATTGALHAGGATGTSSQWIGNITLTGNSTISAADNLLTVGSGAASGGFTNTLSLGSNTLTLNTPNAATVTPVYLPFTSYILDDSNVVINSIISGTGGITKTGQGTATLISTNQNSYTGATTINDGKLVVDGAENKPVISSTSVVIGDGTGAANSAVLQMGQLDTAYATGNGYIGTYVEGTNTASTSMTIYEDGLFNTNGGSNFLKLLTLQGGHVSGGDATQSPLLTLTDGITTLASAQTALIEEGEIGMSGNGFTFNIADGAAATDLKVDSILHNGIGFTSADNTNSLVKTGTGTLVLTALNADGGTDDGNDYSGVTSVQAGVLNIQHNKALGQDSITLGSLNNGTVVASGAQLQLQSNGTSGDLTIGKETLTLSGTGVSNTGALLNKAGNNTYNGYVYLNADARINAASGTTLNIANTAGVNAGIMNGSSSGKNLTVGGSGNTIINGAIGSNVNNITKDGTGTLTLAGLNAYAGATAVTSGAVKVTHSNGLSGTGATVTSGAALQFAQNASSANINVIAVASTINGTGLSNGGAIQNLNGANTYAGNITLGSNSRITANSGSSLTMSGNLIGAGNNLDAGGAGNTTYNGIVSGTGTTVTKTDAGTVTFGGTSANTFTGGLNIDEGTVNFNKTAGVNALAANSTITIGDSTGSANTANLAIQANNQMPDTTDIVLNSDGRIQMGTAFDAVSQVTGSGQIDLGTGTINMTTGTTTGGKLTLGGDNSSSTFSGGITGGGTLEKLGSGTLELDNTTDISYAGNLILGGGTLKLTDINLTVGNLFITANTTLDFTGASTLSVGSFAFLNTSIVLNIINWDKTVDFFYATNWAGATQDVLDNLGSKPESQVVFNGWAANNTGWDAYDDQIYPNVPEPSTYGMIFMAACSALFAFKRFRGKRSTKKS